MLTIHPVTSAANAKKYFDVSDYYSDGQETVGLWGGKLAGKLGLSGIVDKASFDRLCDNLHPQTGEQLTLRMNDNRRVGYDFVFSGPKSFSIVEALASEDERRRLLKAFGDSVDETMAEVEQDMHVRVRKDGAEYDRPTRNLVSASFDHSTARPVDGQPPDMQRHRHVFVFNATEDPVEGCIKAGQFGNIKRDGEYYTAAFYARLAKRLKGMGYVIDRLGGKEWEIAGVLQPTIDKFSKRSDEVEAEHAHRLDVNHPDYDPDYREEYKHELAAKTRSKKQKELTPDELRREWLYQLDDGDRDALVKVYGRRIAKGAEVTAEESVSYALQHCFERESVVPERELKRVALLYGLGDVTSDAINAELVRQGVLTGDKEGRVMATTKEIHAQERFITGFAASGRGTVEPVGLAAGLDRRLDGGQSLDDEQWQAVSGVLKSHDRVQMIDAAAGVGKSTAMRKLDEGMRLAGCKVTYLATKTTAVGVLRKDGLAAETVAKFLLSEKMQQAAAKGYVVVDEVSMLGHRDAYRLVTLAKEKDLKLVLLGDSRQHSSVPAGATMRLLQEYGGITPYRISTIKRQLNDQHRESIKLMFEGQTTAGFDMLDQKLGWVKEIEDDGERYRAMAAEYVEAIKGRTKWDEILLISPTHAEGEQITDAIRTQLRAENLLGEEEHEVTRWVGVDMTEAERGDVRNYKSKVDMIQFHQNAKGIKSGTRIDVGDENRATLPLDQAGKFQAYRRETINLSEGDIIRFTANGKSLDGHQIRNGAAYKVKEFTASGIRLDNGWLIARDFGHFKHGIETSYGSQSKTVTHAIVGQSSHSRGASSMEQAYVSASRARNRVTFYTDDKAALREAITRSSLKMVASDIVSAAAEPTPGQNRWRQRLRHWQRLESLARIHAGHDVPRPQPKLQEQELGHGYRR